MSRSPRQAEQLLTRLEWTVIRRLDGLLQGDYRTLFRGVGLDFADLREYQPHDDSRHIDWNVTARTETPHVRVFNEDRDLTAWFIVDLSPSIDFGSGQRDKRSALTEFLAVMARMITHQGNKVGAILSDGVAEIVVPPRAGRSHVLHLIDKVMTNPRRLRAPQTDLGIFLNSAGGVMRRRSAVFVLSDFVSLPGWDHALGQLNRRHEVLAVRITDPLEHALPDIGPLAFEDAETGEQLFVDTTDPGFRHRFAVEAERREEAMINAFVRAGADALELSTEDDLLEAIVRFSGMRKASSRWNTGGTSA